MVRTHICMAYVRHWPSLSISTCMNGTEAAKNYHGIVIRGGKKVLR